MASFSDDQPTCACPGCRELAMEDGIHCPFCEDHHYHRHESDGSIVLRKLASDSDHPNNQESADRFRKYEPFRLAKPLDDSTIPVMSRGVVLEVFGGSPCQYEVEFPDCEGGNLGNSLTYTISEDQMTVDNVER